MKLVVVAKARGRQSLVPMKKLVHRRGAAFEQVFWIRPAEAKRPKREPKHPSEFQAKLPRPDVHISNHPAGGFRVRFEDEKLGKSKPAAFLIPPQNIHGVFEYAGHKFVIHNKVDIAKRLILHSKFVVTEMTTGLRAGYGPEDKSPAEAEKESLKILKRYSKEALDGIIERGGKIADLPTHSLDGKVPEQAPPVSSEELREVAEKMARAYDMLGSVDEILNWIKQNYTDESQQNVEDMARELANEYGPDIIPYAVEKFIDLGSAASIFGNAKDIAYNISEGDVGVKEVLAWADKVKEDLEHFRLRDWGASMFDAGEVFRYAIDNGVNLVRAQEAMLEGEEYGGLRSYEKGGRKAYQNMTPVEIERGIRNGKVHDKAHLGGGCNKTIWVDLKDAPDTQVVWKPESGEEHSLRRNIPRGFYIREAAAYELDKLLDLNLVPPTVIREIDGEIGSLQMFAPDAKHYEDFSDLEHDMAGVLDFIMFNTDRHNKNWMVSNGKLLLIDNGLTFPNYESNYTASFSEPNLSAPPTMMEKMRKADWAGLMNKLIGMGLESEAVDGFSQRLAFVLDHGKLPSYREFSSRSWRTYPTYSSTHTPSREKKS